MIIIKNGDRTIYHPGNPDLKLVNPKLCLEDSAAGSLSFVIYDENPNYGSIRKLFPVISVIRDGRTIFRGRVIAEKRDFYNGREVEAEGKLAFFNDSYMEPFSFKGSPEELFRMIVEGHNAQVMPWQQIKVGAVTVKDSNDYIVRSSEKVMNSWDALKEKCFLSSLGGHIRMRYEEDGDYVDWLEDYDRVSAQSIAFAKNLISLSQETDASETYTAIRPVGAEVEGARIDISSVNGGVPYLVNEGKADEYGIIFAPESESTWEDVTLPENLLKKARDKLYGTMGAMRETYEIRAVDLNLTDSQIEALDICEYVPVVSGPHGIEGNYLLAKADISIAAPQDSVYYLGASRRVLSDSMGSGSGTAEPVPKKVSSFENDAGYVSEEKVGELLKECPKMEDVEKMVTSAVEEIPAGPGGASAYDLAVGKGYEGTEEEWLRSLKGEKGEKGDPIKVRIGKVTTGAPGTDAAVDDVGGDEGMVLDFVLPQGESGEMTEEGCRRMIEAETNGLRFGRNAEGAWGYIVPGGADTVVPFSRGGGGTGSVLAAYDAAVTRLLGSLVLASHTVTAAAGGHWIRDGGFVQEIKALEVL